MAKNGCTCCYCLAHTGITITSTPPTLGTVGVLYQYFATATNSLSGTDFPFTWSLDVFPTGMTIDSVTGIISWTPALGQEGLNSVTVRVDDPCDAQTQNYTIDVA